MIPNLSTAFSNFSKISNFLPRKARHPQGFSGDPHHLDSWQEIAVSSANPKKIQKSETLNTSLRGTSPVQNRS